MLPNKQVVAIWITNGKYIEDNVPDLSHDHNFEINWSGQPAKYRQAGDDNVGRGTMVFYRKTPTHPFKYIGRVKRKETIRHRVAGDVAGLYRLTIRKTTSYGREFPNLFGDNKSGCYKRAVTRTLGWSEEPAFYFKGISYHTCNQTCSTIL